MSPSFKDVADLIETGDSDIPRLGTAGKVIVNDRNQPKALLANAITVLRSSPEWNNVIQFDEFALKIVASCSPPWEGSQAGWQTRNWTERDGILTADWLQRRGIEVQPSVAAQAVKVLASESRFHPVRDYLGSLLWDQKPRLSTMFAVYFGSENSEYHAEVGRCSMIAAVARIFEPGCKVDTVPILEGDQGLLKSSAVHALFSPWFTDELADIGNKDAPMQLIGAWGIELSELESMARPEIGRTKAFISRKADRFRPPYGAEVIEHRRSCVFWGTTNSNSYLKDATGGRRFWPVTVTKVDLPRILEARDQLWAEATHRYFERESWWFENRAIQSAAVEEQKSRYVGDPWDEIVSNHLQENSETSVSGILNTVLYIEKGKQSQKDMNRVADILKNKDWVRVQRRKNGKPTYLYVPKGTDPLS